MRKFAISIACVSLSGAAFLACSGDDTSPANSPSDAGGTDSTTQPDTGGGGQDVSQPDTSPPEEAGTDAGNATAARGEYLVKHLLLCGGCHGPAVDGGLPLSGGRAFGIAGPDGGDGGTVWAANLTPSDAGLGTWTSDQIVKALTKGVDDQGKFLSPIMPYATFGNLTVDDALSIALYLKTLTPSGNAVPDRTIEVDAAPPTLDDSKVPHGDGGASAQNGRYLAELGCIDCHTPRTAGKIDLTKAFAGGRLFGTSLTSSNLTPDDPTGIHGWTPQEVSSTLVNGHRKGDDAGATLCTRMPTGPNSFGGLTDGDRTDLGNFFTTLPPVQNGPFETDGGGGAQCQ
jgi:mono/diheme cytochrome c family protein